MIRKLYDKLGSLNLGLWLMAGVTLLMGIGSGLNASIVEIVW